MRKRLDYDETLGKSVKIFINIWIRESINSEAYAVIKATDRALIKKRDEKKAKKQTHHWL